MTKLVGNAVVGQSGGPTAAINATLCGVIHALKEAHAEGTVGTIYGMRHGIEGFLKGDVVDLAAAVPDEMTENLLAHTPAAALGSCRQKLPEDLTDAIYPAILAQLKKFDIRYFFYIGGNDSMDTVRKLHSYTESVGYDIRVIGVPKTIDNDLAITDHTPGFGSAAKYIATIVSEIVCDCAVYTVPAVTIVELMGRDAGWLAASAALPICVTGHGPDYIYLPERAFDDERFLSDVRAALARHPNVVIAVSEGIHYADGCYVGEGHQSGVSDVFGHRYLAGAGKYLEGLVKRNIGCKVRSVEVNLPQRCAAHLLSAVDLRESLSVGAEAVRAALSGVSGAVMIFRRVSTKPYVVKIDHADVSKIANIVRTVPDSYINSEGNGITEEGMDALLPLIEGESAPVYEHGMPKFFRLP